ncbi:unnamed protein product, partial [Didymodactylos carnosus]
MYTFIVFPIVLTLALFQLIHSHGYLIDPPARSSAWLTDKDFRTCCGKCSICGEPSDLKPKLLGIGDAMYLGKIVRTYTQGSIISVTVIMTANHLGHFEFRLCDIDGLTTDATQECLDSTLLQIAGTNSTQFKVDKYPSQATVLVNVTLPSSMTCSHCVFQWKYVTGNSWGTDSRT